MRKTYLVNTTRGLVLVPTLRRAKELAEESARMHKLGRCYYAALRRHSWAGVGVLHSFACNRCAVQVARYTPSGARGEFEHGASEKTWETAFKLSPVAAQLSPVFAEL